MAKYHINQATGNVGPCTATTRACPHGGEENHFGSEAEARKAFEQGNSTDALKPVVKRPGVRLERRAEKHIVPTSWDSVPSTANDEAIKNALAYAIVKGKATVVTYEHIDNNERFKGLDDYYEDSGKSIITGIKKYLIATPNGGLASVTYTADVEAELDHSWEFHPNISAEYKYYGNLESLKAGAPDKVVNYLPVKDDSLTRTPVYYNGRLSGDRLSYDHYNDKDTIATSKKLLRELPTPYDVAKLADLESYKGKISSATLAGEGYFKHDNASIRAAVVKRKEFPSSLQEAALNDPAIEVRMALAAREDIDRPTMELLMGDKPKPTGWGNNVENTVRSTVIQNPKFPVRLQNKILREGSIDDMRALARNPALAAPNRAKLIGKAAQLGFRL